MGPHPKDRAILDAAGWIPDDEAHPESPEYFKYPPLPGYKMYWTHALEFANYGLTATKELLSREGPIRKLEHAYPKECSDGFKMGWKSCFDRVYDTIDGTSKWWRRKS